MTQKRLILVCQPENGAVMGIRSKIIQEGLKITETIHCIQTGATPGAAAITEAFEAYNQKRFEYAVSDSEILTANEFFSRNKIEEALRSLAARLNDGENCLAAVSPKVMQILLGYNRQAKIKIEPLTICRLIVKGQNTIKIAA